MRNDWIETTFEQLTKINMVAIIIRVFFCLTIKNKIRKIIANINSNIKYPLVRSFKSLPK